jgi:hypothetical protein
MQVGGTREKREGKERKRRRKGAEGKRRAGTEEG